MMESDAIDVQKDRTEVWNVIKSLTFSEVCNHKRFIVTLTWKWRMPMWNVWLWCMVNFSSGELIAGSFSYLILFLLFQLKIWWYNHVSCHSFSHTHTHKLVFIREGKNGSPWVMAELDLDAGCFSFLIFIVCW